MKTISISKWVAAVAVMAVMSAFAAPVVNVGTLPIGKSVTIVFQTTINNSVPGGNTQISSSGTVSGNNFSSVIAGPAITPLFIAPIITSATNTTFTVGNSGVFNVTKTGSPIPDLFASGALPNGVGFNPGTGNLAGTPAVGTGGLYPLVFTATNAAGTNTQNFTLTVNQHPAFTNVSSKTFIAGSLGTFKIGASGFPAPTLSETNTDILPGGVGFADNGNGTATLSGTPAGGSGGTYTLHFFATNGVSSDANQTFTLTVNEAPAVNCPSDILTNASGGVCLLPSISFAATATGFPTPAITYQFGGGAITSPTAFPIGTNTVISTATNSFGTNTCSFTVTVLAGAAPQLNIVQQGTNVIVSWPTNFSCYTLQFASTLSSNNWNNYSGPFTTNSGDFIVTNGISITNGFFRLSH
jgi:hypothetical protein